MTANNDDLGAGGHRLTAAAVGVVAPTLALALAFFAGRGGPFFGGLPLLVWLAGLSFLINWIALLPAILWRTEHFYDLTGAITYLSLLVAGVTLVGEASVRTWIVAGLIGLWATRLGLFLFARVKRVGRDERFDQIKKSIPRFFTAWTLQGLWVFVTASAGLIAITDPMPESLGLQEMIGILVWGVGFSLEVIADAQKSAFKKNPENAGRFITSGLWAYSRHPNYLGEIVIWLGIFILASGHFSGAQWLGLASPIFVFVLLTRVSGIPLLEERADARWGGETAYEAYKAKTPVLFPWPARRG
jgi:steroid 5-alpha reductase family enzyme